MLSARNHRPELLRVPDLDLGSVCYRLITCCVPDVLATKVPQRHIHLPIFDFDVDP